MDFEEFLKELGESLKAKREKLGLRQQDLDEGEFAVPTSTYQEAEYGARDLRMSTIFQISRRLGIPVRELFDFDRLD